MLRVIAELKRAYLAPEDVDAIVAALPRGPGATRLGALGRVYAAYERGLERLGAVDRHGREWIVCVGLAAAVTHGERPPTLDRVGRLVFAEIYDFSVLQFLIATSLIRLVGDAELVAFAHAENVEATRFLDRTWNRFVGDPTIADQVLPAFVERGGAMGASRPPCAGSSLPSRRSRRSRTARFASSSRPTATARSRPRSATSAAWSGAATGPERFALLARDMQVYGDLIEDVCRRFQVPVFFRKGQPLLANGLVKACLNVLRCVSEGFPRERLEALLASDYFAAGRPRLQRALRTSGFVADDARPFAACLAHALARLERAAAGEERPERRDERMRRHAELARDGRGARKNSDDARALEGQRTAVGHCGSAPRAHAPSAARGAAGTRAAADGTPRRVRGGEAACHAGAGGRARARRGPAGDVARANSDAC